MPVSPHTLVLDADNTLWDTNAVFQRARTAMTQVLRGTEGHPDLRKPADSGVPDGSDTGDGSADDGAGKKPSETPSGNEKDSEGDNILYRSSQHLPSTEDGGPGPEQLARAAAFYMSDPQNGPEGQASLKSRPGAEVQKARVRWAAEQAQAGRQPPGCDNAQVHEAATAFRSALSAAPPLLEGARLLLNTAQAWRSARPDQRTSVLFSEGKPDRLQVAFEAYQIGDGRYFDDTVFRKNTPSAFRQVC